MLASYIITVLLLTLPFYLAFYRKKDISANNSLLVRYGKGMASYVVFLLIIILINRQVLQPVNFFVVGKGWIPPVYLYSTLLVFCTMSFFMAFLPDKKNDEHISQTNGYIYGVPVDLYPGSYSELVSFVSYMVLGVVAEEVIFRQFMFNMFYKVFGIGGDMLLIITSVLFVIAHMGQGAYKKIYPIIILFISGLFYGKAFQMTGSIYYPIVVHLLTNGAIAVLAYKRIKYMRR